MVHLVGHLSPANAYRTLGHLYFDMWRSSNPTLLGLASQANFVNVH